MDRRVVAGLGYTEIFEEVTFTDGIPSCEEYPKIKLPIDCGLLPIVIVAETVSAAVFITLTVPLHTTYTLVPSGLTDTP